MLNNEWTTEYRKKEGQTLEMVKQEMLDFVA